MQSSRIINGVKRKLLPIGKKPRRIVFGLLKNITIDIDFAHQSQIYFGLAERELFSYFNRFSLGVKTAVDVGANAGIYTLYFLMKTKAERVIACEPDSGMCEQLWENARNNNQAETSRLSVLSRFIGSGRTSETLSLDNLLADQSSPMLIKIDVDGPEFEILKGAELTLRKRGISWIVETHSTELESSCIEIFAGHGYSTKIVRNAWWRLLVPEQRPIPHNRWLVAWKT